MHQSENNKEGYALHFVQQLLQINYAVAAATVHANELSQMLLHAVLLRDWSGDLWTRQKNNLKPLNTSFHSRVHLPICVYI